MTDAEISRRLALAIGWKEEEDDIEILQMVTVQKPEINTYVWHCETWALFDYRDPAVIWPIAERFNAFPEKAWGANRWVVERWEPECQYTEVDTAAKAVALAVIKAMGKK